jgi:hypothetical protein
MQHLDVIVSGFMNGSVAANLDIVFNAVGLQLDGEISRHLPGVSGHVAGMVPDLAGQHAEQVRLHLDTDFAGDTDDAAALAMLLGWPGAEVVGVTTTADPGGWRAGYVHRLLELAGREDIPVASGASTSLDGRAMGDLPDHGRY